MHWTENPIANVTDQKKKLCRERSFKRKIS